MDTHPIRLLARGDLERSRLTVFFRLPLAIVHLVWLALWSVLALLTAIVGWFAALALGRLPGALHGFLAAYVRYTTHVVAFLTIAANPFPGFVGAPGSYPIDVEIAPPARLNRWKVGFRFILLIPAAMLSGSLAGGWRGSSYNWSLLVVCAVFAWFVAMGRGRLPAGFRDAMQLALAYMAQYIAYSLLLTDRYPDADPEALISVGAPPPGRAVRLDREPDDSRRHRAKVFFRLVILIPYAIWGYILGVAAEIASVVNWLATLALGHSPRPLHRFIAFALRYWVQVQAFAYLSTDAAPSLIPDERRLAVDVEFDPPVTQHRGKTLFRVILALPALALASAYATVFLTTAFLGWFAAMVTGRMPDGLRKLGLACLAYTTATYAYLLLLTGQYPSTTPHVPRLRGEPPADEAVVPVAT